VVPAVALGLAVVCLIAMVWFNPLIAAVFLGLMLLGAAFCRLVLNREPAVAVTPGA
jgi:ethanolamine permease